MDRVFIYWDTSNIFHEAQRLAEEKSEGPGARYRVRLDFENTLRLAHADRPVEKAIAAGSVPPEMRQLWNRMESEGMRVHLFDRGAPDRGEQEMPDRMLQLEMLQDALDYNGDVGIVVLLTGDGAGYIEGAGFHDPGADAQARLECGDPVVGAFHEPANASMGGGKRHIRGAGRLLRCNHIHGAVAARLRARASSCPG